MKTKYSKKTNTIESFTINERFTFVYKNIVLKEVIYTNIEGNSTCRISGQDFVDMNDYFEYTHVNYDKLRIESKESNK